METDLSFEKMTKKELIQYCISNQIKGISNRNKGEIIKLIRKTIQDKSLQISQISKHEAVLELNKHLDIIKSSEQTKEWRKSCSWYKNGKSNECENYQKKIIKQLIGYEIKKCNDRFYIETNNIIAKVNPMKDIDGFEYTEDFDGKCTLGKNTIYFNLKFCCDAGGAQTRTLRLVYDFIKCQIQYINTKSDKIKYEDGDNLEELCDTYFINILDGDTCNTHTSQFRYLLDKLNDEKLKKYVFIGSMYDFSNERILLDLLKTNQNKIFIVSKNLLDLEYIH